MELWQEGYQNTKGSPLMCSQRCQLGWFSKHGIIQTPVLQTLEQGELKELKMSKIIRSFHMANATTRLQILSIQFHHICFNLWPPISKIQLSAK